MVEYICGVCKSNRWLIVLGGEDGEIHSLCLKCTQFDTAFNTVKEVIQ